MPQNIIDEIKESKNLNRLLEEIVKFQLRIEANIQWETQAFRFDEIPLGWEPFANMKGDDVLCRHRYLK